MAVLNEWDAVENNADHWDDEKNPPKPEDAPIIRKLEAQIAFIEEELLVGDIHGRCFVDHGGDFWSERHRIFQ